jgi:small subunit ribosomal protein S2
MTNQQLQKSMVKSMIKAGVHCGHSIQELNPKMKPYLFGENKGKYVIDIFYTIRLLSEAVKFVRKIARKNGQFLIVGTNPQKADFIAHYAQNAQCHYVTHKWLGGMLTNWSTIEKRIQILTTLDLQEKSGMLQRMPKKESAVLNKRLAKLRKYLNGIKYMLHLPDAVIVVDQNQDSTAIQECQKLAIPVICIVDTNCDPTIVDIPIPANDDSISSVRLILQYLLEAIQSERALVQATEDSRRPA